MYISISQEPRWDNQRQSRDAGRSLNCLCFDGGAARGTRRKIKKAWRGKEFAATEVLLEFLFALCIIYVLSLGFSREAWRSQILFSHFLKEPFSSPLFLSSRSLPKRRKFNSTLTSTTTLIHRRHSIPSLLR